MKFADKIIISLPSLRPRDLLQSHSSIYRVSPKTFPHLVGNIQSGMGLLNGVFEFFTAEDEGRTFH
jgi:hypothetical protein